VAADHKSANIWTDKTVKFLDPCTKSGVFLREITSRLIKGLADEIPTLDERVNHILTKQVFGIGITYLTSLLARRSVYCSKHAKRQALHRKDFASDAGNIWFERLEHTWVHGKCAYCGANARDYDRGGGLETHAYAFIHTDDLKARLGEMFGGVMQFDVIIGNPPYQLGQSGGDAIGNFAMPIYQKFVDAAKGIEPAISQWLFRRVGLRAVVDSTTSDRKCSRTDACASWLITQILVKYSPASTSLAGSPTFCGTRLGTEVRGHHNLGGATGTTMSRYLNEYDILVRYNEAVPILEKVFGSTGGGTFDSMATQVAPIQPFSIRTNFRGAPSADGMAKPVLIYQNGGTGFIERDAIPRNDDWVDQWKVFLSGSAASIAAKD